MNVLVNLQNNSSTTKELSKFINLNFQEIYDFFYNQTQIELYKHKKEIKQYLKSFNHIITSLDCSNKINGDFIALLIETCEKLHLLMQFNLLYNYLSKSDYVVGNRLKATSCYCTGIKKFDDYYEKLPDILSLLQSAYDDENESTELLTVTLVNFYLDIIYNFGQYNKKAVSDLKNQMLLQLDENAFFDIEFINTILSINIDDYRKAYDDSIGFVNDYLFTNNIINCVLDNSVAIEVSDYSNILRGFSNLEFDSILDVSKYYVKSNIGSNEKKIHYSLNRGVGILEEERQLYQYIKSFGEMHKAKLYSSFDTVIHQLNNQIINIIDWGCGQALATTLLIDYIKEKNLQINISNVILIEPSSIALSRGMLHIDILKENEISIKAINKDIDCLEEINLQFDNDNITLHLFSNILDVEFFKLDKAFLEKISNSQNKVNAFICISPNINDKRNGRLDMFYRYFEDNFETKLISDRNTKIDDYSRYEKVFKVNILKQD